MSGDDVEGIDFDESARQRRLAEERAGVIVVNVSELEAKTIDASLIYGPLCNYRLADLRTVHLDDVEDACFAVLQIIISGGELVDVEDGRIDFVEHEQ